MRWGKKSNKFINLTKDRDEEQSPMYEKFVTMTIAIKTKNDLIAFKHHCRLMSA